MSDTTAGGGGSAGSGGGMKISMPWEWPRRTQMISLAAVFMTIFMLSRYDTLMDWWLSRSMHHPDGNVNLTTLHNRLNRVMTKSGKPHPGGIYSFEDEQQYLIRRVIRPSHTDASLRPINRVCETRVPIGGDRNSGGTCGFSTAMFLTATKDMRVYSFDDGPTAGQLSSSSASAEPFVALATNPAATKSTPPKPNFASQCAFLIDSLFPGRSFVTSGDPVTQMNAFRRANPDTTCDLLYHQHTAAGIRALQALIALGRCGSLVVSDWCIGDERAQADWDVAVASPDGLLTPIECHSAQLTKGRPNSCELIKFCIARIKKLSPTASACPVIAKSP